MKFVTPEEFYKLPAGVIYSEEGEGCLELKGETNVEEEYFDYLDLLGGYVNYSDCTIRKDFERWDKSGLYYDTPDVRFVVYDDEDVKALISVLQETLQDEEDKL